MCRGWAFVTQPECDDGDVNPSLHEVYRRGVADRKRVQSSDKQIQGNHNRNN